MNLLIAILVGQASLPSAPTSIPPQPASNAPVPLGNSGTWITAADIPAAAKNDPGKGALTYRLNVDARGKPTGCTVTESSGRKLLDDAVCTVVQKRARFKPGVDSEGRAQSSTYSARMRFAAPTGVRPNHSILLVDDAGRPRVSQMRWKFIVEADGSVSQCVSEVTVKAESDAIQPYSPCASDQHYKPMLDAAGKPVRKQVIFTINTDIIDPPKD